jgi:hypothetical protein
VVEKIISESVILVKDPDTGKLDTVHSDYAKPYYDRSGSPVGRGLRTEGDDSTETEMVPEDSYFPTDPHYGDLTIETGDGEGSPFEPFREEWDDSFHTPNQSQASSLPGGEMTPHLFQSARGDSEMESATSRMSSSSGDDARTPVAKDSMLKRVTVRLKDVMKSGVKKLTFSDPVTTSSPNRDSSEDADIEEMPAATGNSRLGQIEADVNITPNPSDLEENLIDTPLSTDERLKKRKKRTAQELALEEAELFSRDRVARTRPRNTNQNISWKD